MLNFFFSTFDLRYKYLLCIFIISVAMKKRSFIILSVTTRVQTFESICIAISNSIFL